MSELLSGLPGSTYWCPLPNLQQADSDRSFVSPILHRSAGSMTYLLMQRFSCRMLKENQFTSIPTGAFAGLGSLNTLSVVSPRAVCHNLEPRFCRILGGNWITSIASGAFTGLGSLRTLCVRPLGKIFRTNVPTLIGF